MKHTIEIDGERRNIDSRPIDSCPDVVPFYALGPQHWRRSALEKRGFRLARETVCPEQQAQFRRQSIERILSGQFKDGDWDVKTYPGNIADVKRIAGASDWEAVVDRNYVMAFDLQQQLWPERP